MCYSNPHANPEDYYHFFFFFFPKMRTQSLRESQKAAQLVTLSLSSSLPASPVSHHVSTPLHGPFPTPRGTGDSRASEGVNKDDYSQHSRNTYSVPAN